MRIRGLIFRYILASVFFVAGFGVAGAQNLVVNPAFDTSDLSAWTANGATFAFDATKNEVGAAGSGSMSVTNTVGMGVTVFVSQCISASLAAGTYDFGGWILLPTGQAGTGTASVETSLYASTDCTGASLAFLNVIAQPADTWNLYTSAITAPVAFSSAAVGLRIDMPLNSQPPLTGWFDGVRFGPAPTLPVEVQSFEVD